MGEAERKDALIVGGGLIGLVTAHQLLRTLPDLKVTVLEKEDRLARHQSGRVLGVLGTGLGRESGWLEPARFREGRLALERFCEEEGIPWRNCGALMVAAGGEEAWLQKLAAEAEMAGIDAEWWPAERMREETPQVGGVAGLCLPEVGIVDYQTVCERLAKRIHELGGEFVGGTEVIGWTQDEHAVRVQSRKREFHSRVLYNCAGIEADRLARRSGFDPGMRVVPFQARRYELDAGGRSAVDRVLERVPAPGAREESERVRLVPTVDGRVECEGAGLALAWCRHPGADVLETGREWMERLREPGFVPWLRRDGAGLWQAHWPDWSRRSCVQEARVLVPALEGYQFDFVKTGTVGRPLRADGRFATDVEVASDRRVAHVFHVPEEGATAAFLLARRLVGMLVPNLV